MSNDRSNEVDHERLDQLRAGQGPIEQHLIDELAAGRLGRRDFLRKATMFGIGLPLAGAMLEAVAPAQSAAAAGIAHQAKSGATSSVMEPARRGVGARIRAGTLVPAGAINPLTIADSGGLDLLGNVGEFLVFTDQHNRYHPWLATSWKANADATVWTFKIRQGVRFNDGRHMTIDDVVYSLKTQCDPKSSANALSVFGGTLEPEGVVKENETTLALHLKQADGGFLDAVSEDNYNMIIVPKNYDYANYQKDFIGTGRFKMKSYTPSVGAVYGRNPYYWGRAALPKEIEWSFYATETPMTAALQSGSIDCLFQFSVAASPQLLNGNYHVISLKAAAHREISMRTDLHPFTSRYVRQAIALSLDRPAIIRALFQGRAQIGNDSPFAPVFTSTVGPPAVPQRKRDLRRAKHLLAKGGVPRGFRTPLVTETTQEMPHLAEIIAASAKQIGVDISLTIEAPSKYYGTATFGHSDWLDAKMSEVDYGARAVPNLYLEAPLQSPNKKTGEGSWNAARFNNRGYDRLSREFVAAVDLSTQRRLARKIELLLLDETPIMFPYFYDYLSASQKNVRGTYPTAQGQFFLWNTTKT
ncbi:MAG: ABC transporter substrate-binding protein [Acidimicrobiales bacterium]